MEYMEYGIWNIKPQQQTHGKRTSVGLSVRWQFAGGRQQKLTGLP